MSQYPRPPSFHGPFNPNPNPSPNPNPNPNVTPPLATAPNGMSQFPYHQYANPYPYSATSPSMNGALPVAGLNTTPFGVNGRMANGPFLQTTYPQTQVPYGMLPQTSPVALPREANLGSMQPHNSLPQKPPPVAAMTEIFPHTYRAFGRPFVTNISEPEDGELSEGGFGKKSREPLAYTQKPSYESPNSESGEKLDQSAGNARNAAENGNQQLKKLQLSKFSNSAYHTQSEMNDAKTALRESHDNRKGSQSPAENMSTKQALASKPSLEDNTGRTAVGFSRDSSPHEDTAGIAKWQRLRDSAKDALKDFHDRGLSFSQLVNAGIDSDILCELYSELNILVSSTQLLGNTQVVGVNNIGSGSERIDHPRGTNNPTQADITNDKSLEKLRKDGKKEQISEDSSNGLESKNLGNQSSLETKDYVNGSEANGSSTHESDARATKNLNPVPKPLQFVKPNKSTATNLLVKSITAKPGDKGLEERKDYIARMLAAKSGKPISVASTTLSPQNPADRERTSQPASKFQKPRPAAAAEGQCLDVDDIPTKTTLGDLKTMETVSINHPTGINAAYGQAMLSSVSEAQRAITEISGTSLHEQRVSVPLAPSFDSAKQTNKAVVHTDGGQSSENILNSTIKNETDAEAKKRAKTELARQKIGELKNKGNIAQSSNRTNPKGLRPSLESVEESQLRLSQEELTGTGYFTPISQATPASSTFAKLSRKPTVTIPGLFMESIPPEPVLITDQFQSSLDKAEAQATPYILPISYPPDTGAKRSEEESEKLPIQSSFGVNFTSLNPVNQVQPVATAEPRRRPKAVDFIDSAPTKARRPLGHNNDTSVIIEVSDNEEIGDTENESIDIDEDIAMDIDEDNFQSSPTKQPNSIESVPGKQKVIRDLPPLSDFPPRKKISLNAVITPPVIQTPAKIKDPESLQTKVKEIELMNRRIAELEQRIKAKQTASRAESPGTPRRSASPKLPEVSVESHEKPRPEASHVIVDKGDEQIEVRNSKDVTEATSLPEQTSTVEAADVYVPSEIPEVDEALQIPAQERELGEQHAQDEERTEAETERLRGAQKAMSIEQERIFDEPRAKDIERVKDDAELLRVTEAAEAAERKRKSRLSEIDSGIPVLDAEVEKSKQELSSLEQKVEALKVQVRKAEEWKRSLLEERAELSPPESSAANPEQTEFMVTANQDHLQAEETTAINEIGAPMTAQCIDSVELHQKQHMAYNDNQVTPKSAMQYSSPSLSSSPPSGNAQVQHELIDNQADLMDTSPDNTNGDGVVDYSPEVASVIPEGSVDAEEVYEPPEIPTSNPQAPNRSSRTADSSDSDDYEPPESLSPVEHSMISPVDASTNPVPAASHSAASIGTTSQPVVNLTSATKDQLSTLPDSISADIKPGPAVISNTRAKKFIPYESPLKQFKSFRYHPDYLAEVPHGFRSMTYIHNIDPERPVCRYELAGGICNDDSCDGQHFRNMSLSDETVLLQMGAVPPDLKAQEAQAYRDGLRQVIQNIRERKVKDCSAVASEIAAYRTKFLGDNHKILPL